MLPQRARREMSRDSSLERLPKRGHARICQWFSIETRSLPTLDLRVTFALEFTCFAVNVQSQARRRPPDCSAVSSAARWNQVIVC